METHIEKHDNLTYISYTDPLQRKVTLVKKDDKLWKIIESLFREPYIINDYSAKFLIYGDMHGHITQGLKALKNWEIFSGLKINHILQVGDIGAVDYTSNIDTTTREMAEKDPYELEFLRLHNKTLDNKQLSYLNNLLTDTQIYFPNGNHDDEKFLYDKYYKEMYGNKDSFRYIPTGKVIEIKNNNKYISLAAIGYHKGSRFNDTKSRRADILLTHMPPKSESYPYGDSEINRFISHNKHLYHFFGHARNAPALSNPDINSYGLNELTHKSKINPGSVGFLDYKSEAENRFVYIPETVIDV